MMDQKLNLVFLAMTVACYFAFKKFGLRKWIWLFLLLILVGGFIVGTIQFGVVHASIVTMVTPLVMVLSIAITSSLFRMPLHSNLQPIAGLPWPDYARKQVDLILQQLQGTEFTNFVNCVAHSKMGSKHIMTFLTLAMSNDRRSWIQIETNNTGAKRVGCSLNSRTADGRDLMSANHPDDQDLFQAESFIAAHCDRSEPIEKLLKLHRELCGQHGPLVELTDDVVTEKKNLHARWIKCMLDSRQLKVSGNGNDVQITAGALPSVCTRIIQNMLKI